jgi:arsenate reductase
VRSGFTSPGRWPPALSDPSLRPPPPPSLIPRKPSRAGKPGPGPGQGVGRPLRILFACVGNAARSQMAHGFAQAMGGSRVEARSGGSRPAGEVAAEAVWVMAEKGIDISDHVSQGFDEQWIQDECDLVVTMGCGDDACPAFVGKPLVDWELEDPKGKPVEEFRRIRDDIERRMRMLLAERGVL